MLDPVCCPAGGGTGGNSSPAGPSDSPKSPPPSPHKPSTTLYKDQNDTWVDRHAPASIKPYLKLIRIDRPIGVCERQCPRLLPLRFAAWLHGEREGVFEVSCTEWLCLTLLPVCMLRPPRHHAAAVALLVEHRYRGSPRDCA